MSKRNLKAAKKSKSVLILPLEKFSNKKILQIEYVTAVTLQDNKLLKQLIKLGKQYERISNVYFITYEEVLDLIQRLSSKNKEVSLPNFIKDYAKNVVEDLPQAFLSSNEPLPSDKLALITKIKIIESLYGAYSAEVMTMKQRQRLHSELEELIKYTEAPKGKQKEKPEKKSGKSSSNPQADTKITFLKTPKEPSKTNLGDYVDITLQENEVIFDFNIDNHIQYVVLSGFPDPSLFQDLSKLHVFVSSVIEFSSNSSNSTCLDDFVLQLHKIFETTAFENTALMKFQNTNDKSLPLKKILEKLIFVIQRINYIKRQHLEYIRNLSLFNFGPEPKILDLVCMEKYNRILNNYPPELINVGMIIDALIEEISWRELGPIYSLSDLSITSSDTDCSSTSPKKTVPFQVHEEDIFHMVLQSYKLIGRQYYEKNLEYLKPLKPFEITETIRKNKDTATSTEQYCYCAPLEDYIDNIHLAIFSQMKRSVFEPKQPEEYDFIHNLITYNEPSEYQNALPKIVGKAAPGQVTKQKNDLISNYHLKEDLSTSVLRQFIFQALLEYSHYDYYFCEESEAVLLRFHDNLNEFGIETKFWNASLKTPICLRDFCKFITQEHREWLENNKLPEHKELNEDGNEEECHGLKDINVSEFYKEYEYLLGTSKGTPIEEKKEVFYNILKELQTYPDNSSLSTFCAKSKKLSSFVAYDIQTSQIQLTGHTTIFNSYDGVKVTVDNSRFLTQSPRCSIDLNADDNHLIFHSLRPSSFHFTLKDDTLIHFSKFEKQNKDLTNASKEEVLSVFSQESSLVSTEKLAEEIEELDEEKEKERPAAMSVYDEYWIQILRKYKLPNTFPNFFEKVNVLDKKLDLNSENFDILLEALKAAIYLQHPVYKISTRKSVDFLERKQSPVSLPFAKILNRIMFKPIRRKKKIKGYNLIQYPQINKKQPLNYDFQINLPHGLIITTLPRNRTLTELKQTNKYCKSKEEYRIFYATGTILVKNADGTTTIYRANGDIIQLRDGKEKNVNCTDNMKEIFRKLENEVCPYKLSRCDAPVCKNDCDFKGLLEFGNIPYTTKILLEFEGKKTIVSEGKVTETQTLYVLSENDYHAEETFFKREDDLRSLINKKGHRIIQFPDGTIITAYPKIEEDLIFVSKNPKAEGWVSVVINYKFEHPNYIPIVYNAFENSTQIFLQNAVMKNYKNSFLLTTEKNVAMEVNSENIIFLKTCSVCDSDCICKINLKVEPEDKLLEVCDSYEKYFACDNVGNCEIHANYMKGHKNKNKCNHQWMHEDKKMFILNKKGPPGTLLWKDSPVEEKMASADQTKNIRILNFMNKLTKRQTIEFYTDIYQKFNERFTMTQLYQNKIYLSKYKHGEEKNNKIAYVTFRILNEFQDLKENVESLQEFTTFVEENSELFSPIVLDEIKSMLNSVAQDKTLKEDVCSYRASMQEMEAHEDNDSALKNDLDKVTVAEIVDNWRKACEKGKYMIRNMHYPPYFQSDYYQYVISHSNKN